MPRDPVTPTLRIPGRIRLPFGYTVKVVQMPPKELLFFAQMNVEGWWDAETRTIYLDKSMPVRRKRYVLIHELQHVMVDFMGWAGDVALMTP